MSKTILKNKSGQILELDGNHVVVTDKNGADAVLNNELAALRATISGLMAASDALVFKGMVSPESALPDSGYSAGWTYKVKEAGIYAGQTCEVGDMIICVADFSEAASDSDWQVLQTNIDGAVTGPATAIAGNLAAFDSATGKVIKDSEVKMADAASAVAMKHEHPNAEVVNALGKDDEGKLTFNGDEVFDGKIDCAVINAGDAIPENLRDNGIIFEIQTA